MSKKEAKKDREARRDAFLQAQGLAVDKATGTAAGTATKTTLDPNNLNNYPPYGYYAKPPKLTTETEDSYKKRVAEWEQNTKAYAQNIPKRRQLYGV